MGEKLQQGDRLPKITLQMLNGSKLTLPDDRSEEHTSELQSRTNLVCRLLLEKKKKKKNKEQKSKQTKKTKQKKKQQKKEKKKKKRRREKNKEVKRDEKEYRYRIER